MVTEEVCDIWADWKLNCLQPLKLLPRLVHLPPSLYLPLHLPLPPLALRDVLTAAMRLATLAAVNLDRPWSLFAQPCCGGDNFLPGCSSLPPVIIERLKVKFLIMRKTWNFKKKKWHTVLLSHQRSRHKKRKKDGGLIEASQLGAVHCWCSAHLEWKG